MFIVIESSVVGILCVPPLETPLNPLPSDLVSQRNSATFCRFGLNGTEQLFIHARCNRLTQRRHNKTKR